MDPAHLPSFLEFRDFVFSVLSLLEATAPHILRLTWLIVLAPALHLPVLSYWTLPVYDALL